MNFEDFDSVPDTGGYDHLCKRLKSDQDAFGIFTLAISMGACVAGGSALASYSAKFMDSMCGTWKDIDLWFDTKASLDSFVFAVKHAYANVRLKPSFGGHAYDIVGAGHPLQIISFRVGNPIEIISEFDFKNCAVAFDRTTIYFHKEVPELLKSKKLAMLNENSPYFLSRVQKYVQKGFNKLEPKIQTRIIGDIDKLLTKMDEVLAEKWPSSSVDEFDVFFVPAKKIYNSVNRNFRDFKAMMYRSAFSDKAEFDRLEKKFDEIAKKWNALQDARMVTYNLPYGYKDSRNPTLKSGGIISMKAFLDEV